MIWCFERFQGDDLSTLLELTKQRSSETLISSQPQQATPHQRAQVRSRHIPKVCLQIDWISFYYFL